MSFDSIKNGIFSNKIHTHVYSRRPPQTLLWTGKYRRVFTYCYILQQDRIYILDEIIVT